VKGGWSEKGADPVDGPTDRSTNQPATALSCSVWADRIDSIMFQDIRTDFFRKLQVQGGRHQGRAATTTLLLAGLWRKNLQVKAIEKYTILFFRCDSNS
jgi:hypothetical protein